MRASPPFFEAYQSWQKIPVMGWAVVFALEKSYDWMNRATWLRGTSGNVDFNFLLDSYLELSSHPSLAEFQSVAHRLNYLPTLKISWKKAADTETIPFLNFYLVFNKLPPEAFTNPFIAKVLKEPPFIRSIILANLPSGKGPIRSATVVGSLVLYSKTEGNIEVIEGTCSESDLPKLAPFFPSITAREMQWLMEYREELSFLEMEKLLEEIVWLNNLEFANFNIACRAIFPREAIELPLIRLTLPLISVLSYLPHEIRNAFVEKLPEKGLSSLPYLAYAARFFLRTNGKTPTYIVERDYYQRLQVSEQLSDEELEVWEESLPNVLSEAALDFLPREAPDLVKILLLQDYKPFDTSILVGTPRLSWVSLCVFQREIHPAFQSRSVTHLLKFLPNVREMEAKRLSELTSPEGWAPLCNEEDFK